jgi:acyl dehydratase
MGIFSDFSEFGAAVGTEIGTNEWGEITQDRINRFADATCDEQWIHIARDRAKNELPGGKTITHGLLSLGLAPMFIRSRPADRLRGRADRSFITAEVCKQALLAGYLTSHQGAQVTGGA